MFALLVRRASKNFVSWVKCRSVQCEPFLGSPAFIYVFGRSGSASFEFDVGFRFSLAKAGNVSCSCLDLVIFSELGDERW